MLLQFSKKDAGTYEVILKDDRGKDTSELKLKDTGQSLFLPHRSRQQWHVALFLLHTRSSRQENRAFGPNAGRRQRVAPGVCVAAGEYGDNAQPGGNRFLGGPGQCVAADTGRNNFKRFCGLLHLFLRALFHYCIF